MPGRSTLAAVVIAVASSAVLSPGVSLADPPTATNPAQPPATSKPAGIPLKSLPPSVRLGVRVNLVERQFAVIPTLVLVPDRASFLAAIRGWTTAPKSATRYPVLIDDGRWSTRQRIIQFVRAFNPSTVVRWDGTIDKTTPAAIAKASVPLEDTPAIVWGAPDAPGLKKQWESVGFLPPGVVVCAKGDPADVAGAALAAWHGQPIIYADPPNSADPTGYMTIAQADAMSAQITGALPGIGYTWNEIGDDIDSVTLCMTSPVKVYLGDGDRRKFYAITDVIGRSDEAGKRKRWAWCGQIMGDAPRAAYDAMCALFLRPDRAWLFDGYDSSQGWSDYDMTATAAELSKININAVVDDGPSGRSLADLRRRAAGTRKAEGVQTAGLGVDAGLIAVTTSGNSEFFDLRPGQGRSVDVPILRRPAMVYFVHSFSAAAPRLRWTVGGMWLERGAYAYLGSVDEPMLSGFIPTPIAMRRLATGLPFGAAVRHDDSPPWKLSVHGDPLITFGPQGPRKESLPLPITNTSDVAAQLPALLKDRDFERALWTLALTGRDRNAARLLAAIAKDDPDRFTPAVALAGISSAYAVGDYQTFLTAAEKIAPLMRDKDRLDRDGLAEVRDMVWQAINPGAARPDARETDLLQSFMRPEVMDRDRAESGAK